ncbi:ABC transporter ATP-binding protein [Alkalicella caledoniensis]|uniref:ABC transporter ATP-binding protein n=1 Tax=Alkalicella caledoniensis TaxID=2731377 RepID=A0A7G9WA61_ALKCA|nr:ABC transporter ATP-binding protein [Alkalicella caledoniensis]QNO15573.1 ABC transporter ATP-binding protein [Alkalicella caledoniensis]
MENVLEIKDLSKKIKDFALDKVSFNLEKGYVMGLVGPNGSGKTTTIRLIMNLLHKDNGYIKIFGMDNTKNERDIKQRIGFVYDENIYPVAMKLEKVAKLVAPLYTNWNQKLFEEYIERFGLDLGKNIGDLSKGMTSKFAVAMAISHKPEFLIMDEPTSGLDPISRREILEIIQELMDDGNTSVLFSTHITSDLEKIADYVTFMDNGKIFESDSYANIAKRYRVVKGNTQILEKYKNEIIGYKGGQFGSEGLSGNWGGFEKMDGIMLQIPSIEDIMFYASRR